MRHATILVAILAFVPLASATAQVPSARVRVTHLPICLPPTYCVGPRRQSVGTFLAWKADSLVMESNGDTLALPLGSVIRLEVRGRGSWGAWKGAGIGLLGGGLLGYLISSGSCSNTGGGRFVPAAGFTLTREQCIGVSTVGGAVVGTLLGLVVGATARADKWKAVPLVRFAPQRDGRFGLGLSVRF